MSDKLKFLFDKNRRKIDAASVSLLALSVSACGGSSNSSSTGTKITLNKLADGTYSEVASVAGIALEDASSAAFTVADAASNKYDITLNATGSGTLEFDFSAGDANDVITLKSDTSVSGFDTLKVVKGTVDLTNLSSLGDIKKIEVDSGVKITFSQLKTSITEIKSVSGDAAVEITVETTAEATALASLVSDGTLSLVGVNTSELKVEQSPTATETVDTTVITSTLDTLKTNVSAPTTTTTTSTPTVAPFDVSVGADGSVEFSGTATGNISLEWAGTVGSSKASFVRGNYTSESQADFGGSATSVAVGSGLVISDTSADLHNTLFTGAGKVVATASSGDQTLKIQTTGSNSVATGDGNDTVELGNAANVSNDDEYNLGGGEADVIKITADNTSAGAVFDAAGAAGAETITVLASSTVTHNAKVTLEYGSAYDQNMTIDASAMSCDSADFTLAVTNDANTDGDLTVKGSSGKNIIETGDGADVFEMGSIAAFVGTDKIIAGSGTDTLRLTADADSTGGVFDNDHTGIENIEILAGSAADANAVLTLDFQGQNTSALTIDASGMTNSDADFTLAIDSTNEDNADGNYTVTGGAGDDSITTGDGNDTIVGGAGNDTIDGDGQGTDGVDTVSYSDITASGDQHGITDAGLLGIVVNLSGSTVAESDIDTAMDTTVGTDDYYVAGNGIANTKAGYIAAANDQAAADGLDIITNVESVVGSARHDYIALGSDMTASGGDGCDTIVGAGGNETISGGNDTDYITGGGGNDTINGGAGDDNIDGGTGNDSIDVGTGTDTVVIKTAGTFAANALNTDAASETVLTTVGIDTIIGFGVGDKIDISGVSNVEIQGTITASADTQLAATTADGAALVSGNYDTATGKFTEGAYDATTANDYLLEFADGSNINAVLILDVAAAIGTMTNSSDVLTAVAPVA